MPRFRTLAAGDPAPSVTQRSPANPRYVLDSAAGRWLVLCFFHSNTHPQTAAALAAVRARTDFFNDQTGCFFGISTDPADEAEARIGNRLPGFRILWDSDLTVSRAYGAACIDSDPAPCRALWVVVDPTMRVYEVIPFAQDGSDIARLGACLDALPPPDRFAGIPLQAPILYLPRVFEPDFCQRLIDLYDAQGGEVSGFMRQIDGRTVGVNDPRHKSRRDVNIEDKALIADLQSRILRRVVPEIAKVHQFHVTRMERYLVACYDAVEGGHFGAHRDNTTSGTAHRRFAVSVNLNADFDGGEVSFPEYGPQGFKAPPGGAVVFSCSLLHAVSRVTRGRRYVFLPFLYDDAAAAIRDRNRALVDHSTLAAAGGATE
ncbi:2OG-Fe(II) oxygenase [Szabonella alba]|uniref:2OG-Fe(II) oxygenase n=1 Tax=Szabonella alba TaxID=2804194 RepID=A0A8K0V9F6_9RHOB|nr:2OG-Fe(II) oxygenase [Szabonella alba]MBL4916108.1 2OG-Fe(II) oxygenase [Szabonella alba]